MRERDANSGYLTKDISTPKDLIPIADRRCIEENMDTIVVLNMVGDCLVEQTTRLGEFIKKQ
jgi:hypothetical protein